MNTLFQFVMYLVFGKRWVLWDMKEGLRMAVFVNEVEIDMQRGKIRRFQDEKQALELQLKELEAKDPLDGLEEGEDKKAYYDAKKLREKSRAAAIDDLKGKIRAQDDNISGSDGELQRIYNIAYHNRVKLDYVSGYKPKKSYADGK